eukprot:2041077-Rhodomonas_salina.3
MGGVCNWQDEGVRHADDVLRDAWTSRGLWLHPRSQHGAEDGAGGEEDRLPCRLALSRRQQRAPHPPRQHHPKGSQKRKFVSSPTPNSHRTTTAQDLGTISVRCN